VLSHKEGSNFDSGATQRLKDYLVQGYSINQKRLEDNKIQFLQTLEDLKILTDRNRILETKGVLSPIQNFSSTFFALDSYDRDNFPKQGTKRKLRLQELSFSMIFSN